MQKSVFDLKKQSFVQQRNIAILAMSIISIAFIILSIVFLNQSKTVVIVPSYVSGEYEVSTKGSANITYLEDMGIATVYNFLNISPETFDFAKTQILRLTSSSKRGVIAALLQRTARLVKARNISTTFRLERIVANPRGNTVKVFGQLLSFMGSKKVSEQKKAYKVSFGFKGATLLLEDFKEIRYEK